MSANQPPIRHRLRLCIAIFVAFTLFGLGTNRTLAQAPELQFERFSIEDGLSSDTVFSILQDSQGFLWFGTWNGLNRYDGYEFTVFKHSPLDSTSLSHAVVEVIYEDQNGTLWVGTLNGLNRFDSATGTFTQYHHDPDNPKSLSNDGVSAIFEDQNGQLWVGTERGLNRFDPVTERFVRYYIDPDDPDSVANFILWNGLFTATDAPSSQATDLFFWVATGEALYQFHPQATSLEGTFTRYDLPEVRFGKHKIVTIFVDSVGTIWISTSDHKLIRFEADATTFTPYSYDLTEPINAIFEDSQDMLWIGTDDGLGRFDRRTETFIWYTHDPNNPYSLSDKIVYVFFEDRGGNLWIGTEIGLNKLNRTVTDFTHYQPIPHTTPNEDEQTHTPEVGVINAIHVEPDGVLWFATEYNGLAKYDPKQERYTFYRHEVNNPNSLSHDTVYAIQGDPDGTLWLGTEVGLDHFDATTAKVTRHNPHTHNMELVLPEDAIWSIYQAESDLLWLGTEECGLVKYAPSQGVLARYPVDDDDQCYLIDLSIQIIVEDKSGQLWLGTSEGLLRANPAEDDFIYYGPDPGTPGSLNDDEIWSIDEDTTGRLWIGTNGGLHQWHPETETFTAYTQEDGLQRDAIYGILADQAGQLWLSSDWGLSRFNPRSATFRNYNVEDGLIANRFIEGVAYQGADGRLFFGHSKGVTAFDPSDFEAKPTTSPVVLTDFRILNQSVSLDQPLSQITDVALSYRDDVITFEFALLDYADPGQNRYLYKLEGFDESWIPADSDRRLATYTDLAGGEYTFRVRGRNSDGLWQEEEVAVRLVVANPPWRTWWAYGLYALFAVALVTAYVRYRTQAQAKALAQAQILNQQLQRIDDLFANAPLCIFEIDLAQSPSTILAANHRAELVYGWSAQEFTKLTLEEVSAADAQRDLDQLRRQVQLGKTVNMEMAHVRRDGSPFPVHINATPGLNDPLKSDVVARHAVVIVEDITLARERLSEMAAIEAERQRIAAEIHDGLAQDLAALRFRVRHWQRLIKQNPERLSAELDEAREILSMSLQDVRRSIFALRPIALDKHGFWPTVTQFVTDFSTQHELRLRLNLPESALPLPSKLELPLFRVIQEALNNVSKHAQASEVSITFQKISHPHIQLIICDNGVGFDLSTAIKSKYGNFGLKQMRERVEALQGTLLIESQPKKGTCLTAKIPLEMDSTQ